jgi:DNA topoisomerase-3
MKKLVLAEKPSVAREIARILHCSKNENSALVGDGYVVTWALGHLVTLALPEELNKEWATWKMEDLPMIPNRYETRVIKETSHQFSAVKSWLLNPQIEELIIATDAGREGELVARWIIEKVGFHKPMKRLWISSMTDQAIRDGFSHLKDAKEYNRLADSAKARAVADWVIGLNVTRALTCKYNSQLSAGRVQTPTLALIVNREKEIQSFTSRDRFLCQIIFRGVTFTYCKNNQEYYFSTEQEAQDFAKKVQQTLLKITGIEKNQKQDLPPFLYDLTALQQDANNLYGFSAKHTLDCIQTLYERYKYLTYPRTDSKVLTTDMISTIPTRIANLNQGEYSAFSQEILKGKLNTSNRIFNNAGVSDHTAIIPTELKPDFFSIETDEKRVFDLVCKRFLAAFLKPYRYEQTKILIACLGGMFKASGNQTIDLGWKKVYNGKEQTISFPNFVLQEPVKIEKIFLAKSRTLPPNRYTEATLLDAMEHAGKFVEDTVEKEALAAANGIGTPATRAEIIERIFSAGYVELKGKTIYPTKKGLQLVGLVPEALRSPSLTATQELHLQNIAVGKENPQTFIQNMEQSAKDLVRVVSTDEKKYQQDNLTQKVCPQCGKNLLEVNNKSGKFLVCIDKTCGYRKPVYRISGLRCPTCHKHLMIVGEKEKEAFTCTCGFKEKRSSFEAKLKENHQNMNHHEMQNYMKKQQNDIPSNNPFADLFNK